LAGGAGTRLHPMTLAASKQLLPIYDKPLVYYPLCTLMHARIRDVLVITTPEDAPAFARLLGDGSRWGIDLRYAVQPEPGGIAQALVIGRDFLAGDPSVLILGDNIFYGHGLPELLRAAAGRTRGTTLFGYWVHDPERYGVAELDEDGRVVELVEKPERPRSNYAVTGLYFYDGEAPRLAAELRPSPRGELEITDLNRRYLEAGEARLERLGRGFAWLDTGTPESMLEAANFIRTVEARQGLKIACPEEVAFRMGFIGPEELESFAGPIGHTDYGRYLLRLLELEREGRGERREPRPLAAV
ncbi:MAG: glucose-1-phosphate thymidylyltransferase RfbA, partial [Gemmatimonadota bacterium]|nr:glucose-1-phosphate thymidylyltransferase RfbA [Gemmatimonadota bacterium]